MLSAAIGLLIRKVTDAVEHGATHEKAVGEFEKWRGQVQVYATVGSMKQLIRSGRISQWKGWLARFLHLRPLVTIDEEGRAIMIDKAFSLKSGLKKIIRKMANDNILREEGYYVMHANAPEEAKVFGKMLEETTGSKPAGSQEISPVLGLHLGAGTVGVAFMR